MRKYKKLDGYNRFDLIKLLPNSGDFIGLELGVAAGAYSAKMVQSGKFATFWGVDMYADTHDTAQYKEALLKVGLGENYKLLRMTFDEALGLFPDQYFDFIYLDGYAENGFEGGQTLRKWARKIKIGGIIGGDDYHEECALLKSIVDEFVDQNELELMLTEGAFDFSAYGHYPSWAVLKHREMVGETSDELRSHGINAAIKSKKKKKNAKLIDKIVRKFLPRQTYEKLRDWNKLRKKQRRIDKAKLGGKNLQK